MKKLSVLLLLAISFCILSAGNVFANESQVDPIDRHSVWSSWFDDKGNRIPDTIDKMKSDSRTMEKASTKTVNSSNTTGERFDFVKETKTYDHAKDGGSFT